MNDKLVTVITASTGNPILPKNIESVRNQTHKNIQHIIVVDGEERVDAVYSLLEQCQFPCPDPVKETVINLPYSIGKDRWNGHRIYGGMSYVAEGDYFIYLDEDNYLDPTHVEDCLNTVSNGHDWAYSLRKIVEKDGTVICNDDCESLGNWPSVLHPQDFFVDVNCYFIPKMLAIQITPLWYRKFREPGHPEVDRVLCHALRQLAPTGTTTGKYSVNYTVGNSVNSVQKEFFLQGNAEMLKRFDGKLPWRSE